MSTEPVHPCPGHPPFERRGPRLDTHPCRTCRRLEHRRYFLHTGLSSEDVHLGVLLLFPSPLASRHLIPPPETNNTQTRTVRSLVRRPDHRDNPPRLFPPTRVWHFDVVPVPPISYRDSEYRHKLGPTRQPLKDQNTCGHSKEWTLQSSGHGFTRPVSPPPPPTTHWCLRSYPPRWDLRLTGGGVSKTPPP